MFASKSSSLGENLRTVHTFAKGGVKVIEGGPIMSTCSVASAELVIPDDEDEGCSRNSVYADDCDDDDDDHDDEGQTEDDEADDDGTFSCCCFLKELISEFKDTRKS
tara:strand:- start:1101 stop:1421 length:321 start_codon:yes stop_codon:yes gene_type:complete